MAEHLSTGEGQVGNAPEFRWPLGYFPALISIFLALYCLDTRHLLLLLLTVGTVVPLIWQYWKWVSGDIKSVGDDMVETISGVLFAAFRFRWVGELAELKNGLFTLLCVGVVSATYKIGTVIFFS